MNNLKTITLLFSSFFSIITIAQNDNQGTDPVPKEEKFIQLSTNNFITENNETRMIFKRKGNFYISWGYNRAFFGKSDIHFWGDGYNFNITDLNAHDEPGGHDFLTYIKPTMFTIPQFNYRMGYFLTDKTYVTFGSDHMKYSLDKQVTLLTGTIDAGSNAGVYNNTEVLVCEEGESGVYLPAYVETLPHGFVKEFEHCDGLNDFSFEIGHLEQLWISKSGNHAFSAQGTLGSGMMIPDSDVDLLEYEPRHDAEAGKKAYHLAGYSFSASVGLQLDFFKHFFLIGKLKSGYINLPDIHTTAMGGKASQHFTFIEPMLVVGYSHDFFKCCKKHDN